MTETATDPQTTDDPQGESAQGPQNRQEPKKAKPEKKPTDYVVLVADASDGTVRWIEAHTCSVKNGREARKDAIEQVKPIGDAVRNGDQVTLAAIPASSWNPTPVGIERTEKLVV